MDVTRTEWEYVQDVDSENSAPTTMGTADGHSNSSGGWYGKIE